MSDLLPKLQSQICEIEKSLSQVNAILENHINNSKKQSREDDKIFLARFEVDIFLIQFDRGLRRIKTSDQVCCRGLCVSKLDQLRHSPDVESLLYNLFYAQRGFALLFEKHLDDFFSLFLSDCKGHK